jgi:hypothetical protein
MQRRIDLNSPLTLADGGEYDLCLSLDVCYTLDEGYVVLGPPSFHEGVDATLSAANIDVPATGKAGEFARSWLAWPGNLDILERETQRAHDSANEPCPDPDYERARVNGRLITDDGRDVS